MIKRKTIGIVLLMLMIIMTAGCSGNIEIENENASSSQMSVDRETTKEPIFEDVQDSSAWYYQPVYWAVDHEVTKGTSETVFSPDQTCTRGEIVTFLWRYFGQQNVKAIVSYTDVSPEKYFFEAVKWAVENGITIGITEDTFSPDGLCTRAQMVTFLWRSAQSPEMGSKDDSFTDVPDNEYFTEAVCWATNNHITYGISDTEFSPHSFCTRSEVVTFLYRASKVFKEISVNVHD